MSMFKSSEFLEEESVQAIRLDESLDKLIIEGKSDLDSREDPELSELLAVGEALRSAADDVTERASFKSFHMRSRAAILHATGSSDTSFKDAGVIGKLIQAVLPLRGSVISAVSASVATLAVILWINPGGGADISNSVAKTTDVNASVQVMTSSVPDSTSDIAESATGNISTSLAANKSEKTSPILVGMDALPNLQEKPKSALPVGAMQSTDDSVTIGEQSVKFDRLQYSRRAAERVAVVTQAIEQSVDAGESVTRDQLFDLTSSLAALGNGIRLDPPGAQYASDLGTYQDVIAQAFVTVHSLNSSSDPLIQGAVTAAKVVAEDSMLIAARYVNSSNILRYD